MPLDDETLYLLDPVAWIRPMEDASAAGGARYVVMASPEGLPGHAARVVDYVTANGGVAVLPLGLFPGNEPLLQQLGFVRQADIHWPGDGSAACHNPRLADFFARWRPSRARGWVHEGRSLAELDWVGPESIAFVAPRGSGSVVAIPAMGGPQGELLEAMLEVARSETGTATVPDYGSDASLPDEDDLRRRISEQEQRLMTDRGSLEELIAWRALIGSTSGGSLVELAKTAFRLVLPPTRWALDESHVDEGAEDLLLTGPGGGVALAEVKGQNSGPKRKDVSQIDGHRGDAIDSSRVADSAHALLCVNQFARSEELDVRLRPVETTIVAFAHARGVLILRSWDLFELVRRELAGRSLNAETWATALAQGGWLKVSLDEEPTLHPS